MGSIIGLPYASAVEPRCHLCQAGRMVQRKIHVMPWPVVVIGYLFLIPSFLGMAFWASFALMTAAEAGVFSQRSQAFAVGWGVVGVGVSGVWIVLCFMAGLFGYLLVMRRRKLQCTLCRATWSAS